MESRKSFLDSTVVLQALILIALGLFLALPAIGWSQQWGPAPAIALGAILMLLVPIFIGKVA